MGRLLIVLVLVVIAIGALGYHQGWFTFSTAKSDKNLNVSAEVDKDKLNAAKEQAKEKVQAVTGQIKHKVEGVGKGSASKESEDSRK